MIHPQDQRGQTLLITLLVLTVATTIALSLIGRSTTDVAINTKLEESAQAFSAAEAGIEEALRTGLGTGGATVLSPNASYNVSIAGVGGGVGVYVFSKKSSRGMTETLWLANHDGDVIDESPAYTAPSVDVCWSSESIVPAIKIAILYKESSDASYRVLRGAYDPLASRRAQNKFSNVTASSGGCGSGSGTTYKQTITFASLNPSVSSASDTLIAARIQPLYSDTQIAVNAPAVALPLQGKRIESVGTTATGTTRKIVVHQQYRSAASIFDAAVYSQGSLGH